MAHGTQPSAQPQCRGPAVSLRWKGQRHVAGGREVEAGGRVVQEAGVRSTLRDMMTVISIRL